MRKLALIVLFAVPILALGQPPQAPPLEKPKWLSPLPYPEGMVGPYETAVYTQEIAVTNGRDRITRVARTKIELKYQYSGGLADISGWSSDKYKIVPSNPLIWIGDIEVKNGIAKPDGGEFTQFNKGLHREWPVGTRFDDVLSAKGKVFEHRTREKTSEGWRSRVLFSDETARPPGYTGIKQSCGSCHNDAGTGGYAVGLAPGSDTVFSVELPWELARGYE